MLHIALLTPTLTLSYRLLTDPTPPNPDPNWFTQQGTLQQEIDKRDKNGVTALMVAARHSSAGDIGALELLVQSKADCHLKDNAGNTALHYTSGEFANWLGCVLSRLLQM